MSKMFNPPHPGTILAEELECLGISAREFARHIKVAPSSVTRILNEEGPVTPEMAVRIAKAIEGPDADMWLRMQASYDAGYKKAQPVADVCQRQDSVLPATGRTEALES